MAQRKSQFLPGTTRSRGLPAISIDNPNLGGIADSIYQGAANSLASIVGLDLHSIPGLIQAQQKLTVQAGGAPTDDLYKIVPCSDGNIYLFGKTLGKVYKNVAGTYTLLGTVSPAAGAVGVLDAREYDGNIYYSMQSRLGQWNFANLFSTRNDNYQIFTNANASYHPMLDVNEVLYIGDGNFVAQFDSATSTFVANALKLKAPQVVCSLGKQVTDLLVGTIVANGVARSHVYRWNTWSVSYTNAYPVNEVGVNAFLPIDDEVIVNAGLNGNLYRLNGSIFQILKQIPGTYSPTQTCIVNYPAIANKQGIPIFGLSNVAGNPSNQAIYGYGSRSIGFPKILTLDFPISTGNLSNVTIWSIAVQNNDIYVSWHDTTGLGSYGIDKLDWSNKYNGGYFESRIIKYTRIFLESYYKFVVNYLSLPTGTSIAVYYKINGGSYVQFDATTEAIVDSDRNEIAIDREIRAKTLQIKVALNVSGNNTPQVEDVIMLLK